MFGNELEVGRCQRILTITYMNLFNVDELRKQDKFVRTPDLFLLECSLRKAVVKK